MANHLLVSSNINSSSCNDILLRRRCHRSYRRRRTHHLPSPTFGPIPPPPHRFRCQTSLLFRKHRPPPLPLYRPHHRRPTRHLVLATRLRLERVQAPPSKDRARSRPVCAPPHLQPYLAPLLHSLSLVSVVGHLRTTRSNDLVSLLLHHHQSS